MPTFFHCNSTHTILSKMNAKISKLQSSSLLSFPSFFVLVYLKHLVCLIMAFPHSIQDVPCLFKDSMFLAYLKTTCFFLFSCQHFSCLIPVSMFLALLKIACFLPFSSQHVPCLFHVSKFLASFKTCFLSLSSQHVCCLFQFSMFLASFK